MLARNCTWALLFFFLAATAHAQDGTGTAAPAPASSASFTIFVSGSPIGREDVDTRRDDSGSLVITSRARLSPPLSSVVELAEFRYAPDWRPRSFVLEATSPVGPVASRTTFENGTAVTEGASAGEPVSVSHEVDAHAIILPNGIFGAYQALASRLADAPAGTELQVYVVPARAVGVRVAAVHDERAQAATTLLDVRRYELVFANPGGDLTVHVTAGTDASLLRVSIPDQGIDVVRSDFTSATARTNIHSNPGDEAVFIPAEGFNLGATITHSGDGPARRPAAILVAGSNAPDRDGFGMGQASIGQLAGALADAGFLVVRYDRRGHAQSGGRAESATLSDHAEDVRAVVRWLRSRRDVDDSRIAVVGHGEGAWVGLLATSRERRISAVVTISAAASSGADLVLEQQQQVLDRLSLTEAERRERVELQERLHEAVRTGRGWETIPSDLRRATDTPWFQSLLAFDPARVVDGIRQPLLIVHPASDREVAVGHADRLATLARRSRAVEVTVVRGVNHVLVPVEQGDASDGTTGRRISDDLTAAISNWLTGTLGTG